MNDLIPPESPALVDNVPVEEKVKQRLPYDEDIGQEQNVSKDEINNNVSKYLYVETDQYIYIYNKQITKSINR